MKRTVLALALRVVVVPASFLLPWAASTAFARPDAAVLQARQDESAKRMADAAARAKALTESVRKAMGDPDARVSRDMAEIEALVGREEFEPAIGTVGITFDHVPDVAEGKRAEVRSGMEKLRAELLAAAEAQAGVVALRELAERLAPLAEQAAANADLVTPLKDVHDSLGRAERAKALPAAEVAELRGDLASLRAGFAARVAAEMREQARIDLEALEAAMPDLRKEWAADRSTCDSAHSKFADAERAIRYSLARVPESDAAAKGLRDRLAKLESEHRATYAKTNGDAVHATILENWQFTADQFAGWETEEGASPVAQDYVDLNGPAYAELGFPRTCALVLRANLWFAYLGTLEEFPLASGHPKVQALVAEIGKHRVAALDRLHKSAESLVAGLEGLAIEEDRVRDRFLVLADWDLRNALQEDPRQWPLVARIHKVVDGYDRKALGDDAALAKIREGAAAAAEANWQKMTQRIPVHGGFDALHSWLFRGRTVRLEQVRDVGTSFQPGSHDLVLCVDGHYFAVTLDPAVKAGAAAILARTKSALAPGDPMEILATVGEESTLRLVASAGKHGGAEIPCRKLTVVGLRSGPVAFLAR